MTPVGCRRHMGCQQTVRQECPSRKEYNKPRLFALKSVWSNRTCVVSYTSPSRKEAERGTVAI